MQCPRHLHRVRCTMASCAMENKATGKLDTRIADAIIQAAGEVIEGKFDDNFPLVVWQTGSGTQSNMNANEVIANKAIEIMGGKIGSKEPVHPNDHVNKSQSTNDAYPTGFRVAVYYYINELLSKINHLTTSLDKKAAEFAKVLKMGRTQLQDAVPMSLGDEFGAWSTNLKEEIKSLQKLLSSSKKDYRLPTKL